MDKGKRITDLEQITRIPSGSTYLVESGDGEGTRKLLHEDLVKSIGDNLQIGDIEELEELEKMKFSEVQDGQEEPEESSVKEKFTLVKAILKVLGVATSVFRGTDGIKGGTAGMVPPPAPEDEGKVLGANGQWVPPGEGGTLDVLKDREELEANTDKGKLVDALVVKEISGNLKFPDGTQFYADIQDGKPGFNTDPERGADTFVPFSNMLNSLNVVKTYGMTTVNTRISTIKQELEANKLYVVYIYSQYNSTHTYSGDNIHVIGTVGAHDSHFAIIKATKETTLTCTTERANASGYYDVSIYVFD